MWEEFTDIRLLIGLLLFFKRIAMLLPLFLVLAKILVD